MENRICSQCGARIPDDAQFCPACGAKAEPEDNDLAPFPANEASTVYVNAPNAPQSNGNPYPPPAYSQGGGNYPPQPNPPQPANGPYRPEPAAPPSNPPATEKEKTGKSSGKKKSVKKYVILVTILLVLIGLLAATAVTVLPAKTNAEKIQNNYLGSEISGIYHNKIEGNPIREKLFINMLSTYPDQVKSAYIKGDLAPNEALSILSDLAELDFFDSKTVTAHKTYITDLEASKAAFAKGVELFNSKRYEEAIVEFAKVIEADSNYTSAQSCIAQCSDNYKKSVISSAETAINSRNYEDAIRILEEADGILADDADVAAALEKAKTDYAAFLKKKALDEAKEQMADSDYPKALKTIDAALTRTPDDAELKAFKTMCIEEYETVTIEKVDESIANYDYSKAELILEAALKVLPDSAAFKNKQAEINSEKPVSLSTLTMINNNNWSWNEGVPKDPFGNDFSKSANYVISTSESSNVTYGEFRAYKQYKRLIGRIAPYTDIGENDELYIQISADGDVVYTSDPITRKTDAFSFDADIKNADYIKIEIRRSNTFRDNVILSDLQLFAE